MKRLGFLIAFLISTQAFAGFQGYNETTSLGIFNKLKCHTGLTCTKVGDTFSVVSSPSISTGSLSITGPNDTNNASLLMIADRGDDNGDSWQLQSVAATNSFTLSNNTSGSQVAKFTITTGGNATVAGTLTSTGVFTPTAGIAASAATKTIWSTWAPEVVTNATSATPSATAVQMVQIHVPHNQTFTGVGVLNAATCGTNKWIVALFDSSGTALANSSTAGTLCSGASAYQKIAFTAPYTGIGPKTYWIGVYADGTTDRYYAIPTVGQAFSLAGAVTGQTFGTVANVTLPTTFTADKGVVSYVY